ncbi:DM13 domain-containing protein [Streptomyces sp. NPDC005805]|uniref:DM13 domain-containing protein n=1 Tax=Streptomyces sp. NPDC005805 TaxID=3157068 RepID=UPI0033E9AB0E
MNGTRKRRRPALAVAAAVLTVALGAGLYWFQPWKLWQDRTVEESLTDATAAQPARTGDATDPADGGGADGGGGGATGPRTLADGKLISHEHATSGTVKLVRLADGSQVIRLEDLDTSNGPDLRVLLTDAPVKDGRAGWHVFDQGKHISLGKLKGNKGSQNYRIPEGIDPAAYSSVSIWCDRFDVSFGAAELTRAV